MLFDRLQTARRSAIRHALAAERAGFSAHEQALTEILLVRAAPAVRVWTFTQFEEAAIGADWLWWWRGVGEWFGVLMQAKRHKPKKSTLVRLRVSDRFGSATGRSAAEDIE